MNSFDRHYPVMRNECIDNLNIEPDGIYLDGTLGMGGHSSLIASKLKNGRLICFDRDITAIEYCRPRLADFGGKITFIHSDFRNIPDKLNDLGIEGVNGMLFDLGVSSPQLDDADRGFSYMNDAPLDMRMDRENPFTAYEIVNNWSAQDLTKILWNYGEEKYASRIVAEIIRRREISAISSTLELVEAIKAAMPAPALREKQHPAKRTFQAIRIAVNDELGAVSDMIDRAPDYLLKGGRICVISFHSLEDRIIKQGMNSREHGCICPREAPICVCGFKQTLKVITKKPILPSSTELLENPRSRSAKLRVAEKVDII